MSSTPLPKRRRLGTSSSSSTYNSKTSTSSNNALSKPFKSPFKTPLKSANPSHTLTTSTTTPTPTTTSTASILPSPNTTTICALSTQPPPTTPTTTTTTSPSSLTSLQSQHTALLAQVSASRARLETCIQAQKLEGSESDKELKNLVRMWKGASRRAADEVFEGCRKKVLGMGGLRAWRESAGSSWGWDEEGKRGEKRGGDDGENEDEDEDGEKKKQEEEEEEEEDFTMAMMLQSLGIELDVIGYDKEGQRWTD